MNEKQNILEERSQGKQRKLPKLGDCEEIGCRRKEKRLNGSVLEKGEKMRMKKTKTMQEVNEE